MTTAQTKLERDALLRTPEAQRDFERERVREHYEHHPEIFSLVLGKTMAYSTGVFVDDHADLERAQECKLERIRRRLDILGGETVLDVGCGWGSVLLHLLRTTAGSFHGITLSQRQRQVVLQRAAAEGAGDRVRIDCCHIEDLKLPEASVDAVLFSGSIVHMHHRETVHAWVSRVLKPGGRVLISDCYFPGEVRGDRYSEATQYIFAKALGYCRLLRLGEELSLMERVGLDVLHVEDLTRHYARTLGLWIDNVRRHRDRINSLSPGFARVLQCYMTVARLSFQRRSALEYMILASKGPPRADVASWSHT